MGLRPFPALTFVPDREKFLVDCARGKRVLHLGCADAIHFAQHAAQGRLLHELLRGVAQSLHGVDLEPKAIARLKAHLREDRLYAANVEQLAIQFGTGFDVIIAGELIEHLNNPGNFLRSISQYMGAETQLIVTTPNLLSAKVFLHSLRGTQRMHPDHSLGFSFSPLQTLLERHGLHVSRWFTTVEIFSSRRNAAANRLLSLCFRAFPRYADTLIAVVRKAAPEAKPGLNEPRA
jgi:predicted TPR repeat methyltransferase